MKFVRKLREARPVIQTESVQTRNFLLGAAQPGEDYMSEQIYPENAVFQSKYTPKPRLSSYKMDIFNETFVHLPEYRVVVCKGCMHAVVPAQIRGHLQRNHRKIRPQARVEIEGIFHELPDVAQTPEEVIYPAPESAAIGWLPVYRDGFQCLGRNAAGGLCPFVCYGKKIFHIEQHYIKQHGWQTNQVRGRTTDGQSRQPSNRIWQD